MKKLLYAILIIAASLPVSCLDEDYNQDKLLPEDDETRARRTYNYVNIQNTYFSLDPALVAFRFNMLWNTASKPRGTISNVPYTTEFHGTSNLKTDLFGTNTITETGLASGTWTIEFRANNWGEAFYDRNRAGEIRITTNNKTLEELEVGESWTINFRSGGTEYEEPGDFYRQVTTEQGTGAITPDTYLKFSEYKITRTRGNASDFVWAITGTSYADTGSKYNDLAKPKEPLTPANWKFDYTISWIRATQDATYQTYTEVMASRYYLTGRASGKPNMMDRTIDHWETKSSVILKPTCNPDAKYGGQEEILINLEEFAEGNPDIGIDDVRITVTFIDNTECSSTTELTYKGKTYEYN